MPRLVRGTDVVGIGTGVASGTRTAWTSCDVRGLVVAGRTSSIVSLTASDERGAALFVQTFDGRIGDDRDGRDGMFVGRTGRVRAGTTGGRGGMKEDAAGKMGGMATGTCLVRESGVSTGGMIVEDVMTGGDRVEANGPVDLRIGSGVTGTAVAGVGSPVTDLRGDRGILVPKA